MGSEGNATHNMDVNRGGHARPWGQSADRAGVERALRETEERLDLALESGRMAIWEWDIAADRVEWSRGLEAIHGKLSGMHGGRFADFFRNIHPEDEPRVVETVRHTAAIGTPFQVHYRIIDPEGRIVWLEARGRLLRGTDDEPERVMGLCSDITERKRAEMAIDDIGRRKDGFLALLGHELRNPLAPIVNCIQVIRQPSATLANIEHAWQIMERQVGHLSRLVDDLLDVSRMESGQIVLSKEHVDLVSLIRQEVVHHQVLMRAKGLSVDQELPAEPVMIDGDWTRIAQMFGNLLHNAAKFTERGGTVSITVRHEPDAAVLSVRDTGTGITADVLERIFEPFSQAEAGLDRSRGGLGLGLAVVKATVDLHGGTVQAHSQGIGTGSEFIVRLPLAATLETRADSGQHSPSGSPLRILLIEDNPDAAMSMRLMLELENYQVAIATEGGPGLDLARVFGPDLVLCDIGLPGSWDGYAVARAFRADPALSSIPLVAFTGYGETGDRERSIAAGFDAHLTKPVRYETLRRLFGTLGLRSLTRLR